MAIQILGGVGYLVSAEHYCGIVVMPITRVRPKSILDGHEGLFGGISRIPRVIRNSTNAMAVHVGPFTAGKTLSRQLQSLSLAVDIL